MKQKKLTITLDQDEIAQLSKIAAAGGISTTGAAEQFVSAGLECGEPVHRIDPFVVKTLCDADGTWRAVNTGLGVTCPRCLELLYANMEGGLP